ncbi:MAG: DUF3368 domain-containing protein [Planctomycetes bacterium]|nr:DUF3368 domain-containing protein [Planctomycetota bacterium]
MIVVSDTGPINYLILIEHLDLLPRLDGDVIIPQSVAQELSSPSSPPAAVAMILTPPDWLKITPVGVSDDTLNDLGDGEREAISLAKSLEADLLLCDDGDARAAARSRDIRVVGTLGALQEAAEAGMLDFADAISKLQRTNFRISRTLREALLSRHRQPPTSEN